MLEKLKITKLWSKLRKRSYLPLFIAFILTLFIFGYLGYYIGIKTFKPTNNHCPVCQECEKCQECQECEICDVDNEDDDDEDPLIDLGPFTNDNKELMAKRYLMVFRDITDNIGLVTNAKLEDKGLIFRSYAYRNETTVDIPAQESRNMGLINDEQLQDLIEYGFDQVIKLSQDTFKNYYKVIFGENDLKNASKNLPEWKLINGYYYFSDTNISGRGGFEMAIFDSVKINSNTVEIKYLFGLFNDIDGYYICGGKTYSMEEVEARGWTSKDDDITPIKHCGTYKNLILNKNSDGTYYVYRIDNVN